MGKYMIAINEFLVSAEPGKVFPLLCPVREYEWIPTWKCDMILSKSGLNEKGSIFKTENSYGAKTMIWTTQEFDPSTYTVRFTNFASSGFIVNLKINLFETEKPKACKAVWRYEFIPVSEEGDKAVAEISKKEVEKGIKKLGLLMEKYLSK